MGQIRLKISDLFELEPKDTDRAADLGAVTAYVVKHYAFLPKPIAVTLEGDEVVISYPEEPDTKTQEAARLVDRAYQRISTLWTLNFGRCPTLYRRWRKWLQS
jgi:hypothetical protein